MARRGDLLKSAVRLFHEKGYTATTVRDIAEKLGVTSAALYNYVSSKEELLYEILDHALSIAERHLAQALAVEVPLDRRLRAVIYHHTLSVLDESQPMMAVFFQEVGLAHAVQWPEIDQRRTRYQETVGRVFEEAAHQGVIKTPNARVTALGVLGMCNWAHRWYRPAGPMTREQIAEHFADLVLHGLLSGEREAVATGQPPMSSLAPEAEPA